MIPSCSPHAKDTDLPEEMYGIIEPQDGENPSRAVLESRSNNNRNY